MFHEGDFPTLQATLDFAVDGFTAEYNPNIAFALSSTIAAIFLHVVLYQIKIKPQEFTSVEDGELWITRDRDAWSALIHMLPEEKEQARRILLDKGILKEKTDAMKGTFSFSPNLKKIEEMQAFQWNLS